MVSRGRKSTDFVDLLNAEGGGECFLCGEFSDTSWKQRQGASLPSEGISQKRKHTLKLSSFCCCVGVSVSFFVWLLLFFKARFLCVALAVLEAL